MFGLPHAKVPVNMSRDIWNSQAICVRGLVRRVCLPLLLSDGRISDAETLSADVVPTAVAINQNDCFKKLQCENEYISQKIAGGTERVIIVDKCPPS